MNGKLSFNKFAMTLAALGAAGTSVGSAAASPVQATETQSAIELGDKDDGKKKKKDGSCGSDGGCGAGSCG